MKELIVIAYDDKKGTREALRLLRRLGDDWVAFVDNAVTVERDVEGGVRVQESYQMTSKEGAGLGAFVGTVLGGLALAPLTGGLGPAAAVVRVAADAVGGAALGGMTGASEARARKEYSGLP